MNSKNNLEMNNKIEICNEGKKAYDIVLRDSFADLLDQMEFLEIEKKKAFVTSGFHMDGAKYIYFIFLSL